MKKTRYLTTALLLAGSMISLSALAQQDAAQIEAQASGTLVNYGGAGDPVANPIITAVLTQPGMVGGHNYTSWAFLAQDSTGSLDMFGSLTGLGYTPTLGDAITVSGTFSPFHQIPEIGTITAIGASSSGNPVPAASVFTVSQLNQTTLPLNIAGYWVEIQNATISGGTTWNSYSQGNQTLTVTDATGSMTLYDWVTSYSTDAAMGGNPIPTGPVNIYGFDSVFNNTSPEFTPIVVQSVIPEPSVLSLFGAGSALAYVASRLRRKV
jgi:hypothetical protein